MLLKTLVSKERTLKTKNRPESLRSCTVKGVSF